MTEEQSSYMVTKIELQERIEKARNKMLKSRAKAIAAQVVIEKIRATWSTTSEGMFDTLVKAQSDRLRAAEELWLTEEELWLAEKEALGCEKENLSAALI